MTWLPAALIWFRGGAALAILVICLIAPSARAAIVPLIWMGLASDIADGMVARRLGIATDDLRRLDSAVYVLFWLSILLAALVLEPVALIPWAFWLLGLVLGEGAIYGLNRWRFGRGSATHAWSAKLFGLGMLAGFSELFLTGMTGPWFIGMVVLGYVALVDVLSIAFILPSWQHDVPSSWHAWRIRQRGN